MHQIFHRHSPGGADVIKKLIGGDKWSRAHPTIAIFELGLSSDSGMMPREFRDNIFNGSGELSCWQTEKQTNIRTDKQTESQTDTAVKNTTLAMLRCVKRPSWNATIEQLWECLFEINNNMYTTVYSCDSSPVYMQYHQHQYWEITLYYTSECNTRTIIIQ